MYSWQGLQQRDTRFEEGRKGEAGGGSVGRGTDEVKAQNTPHFPQPISYPQGGRLEDSSTGRKVVQI